MDTESIEERSITDLQEILKRLGGWPVVEGDDWDGEDFNWWDLSLRASAVGLSSSGLGPSGLFLY